MSVQSNLSTVPTVIGGAIPPLAVADGTTSVPVTGAGQTIYANTQMQTAGGRKVTMQDVINALENLQGWL